MIKETVVQKTNFICDRCKEHKTIETELEEYDGEYGKIDEYVPEGFHEIEELKLLLCDKCFKELKTWVNH